MSDLEKFLHDQAIQLPMLVKSALAHAQFETIHPFLDGNGRVGRLLITLHLLENKVLEQPLLYLSLYFKTYRSEYYERLMRVRTHGEWSQWIDFFLVGVTETAQQAAVAAQEILALFERDRKKIETLGRAASSALRVHEFLQRQPILLVPRAANSLALSAPTIRSALGNLSKLGVVNEFSGHRRKRTYVYSEYLKLLEQGTEPIARNEANLG
jgi:Fic family protein